MKRIIQLTVISCLMSACASYSVKKTAEIDLTQKSISGVTYTLPKKEFKLIINYKMVSSLPSKYAASDNFMKLVKPLLPEFEFEQDTVTKYAISKIELQPYSVPDSSRVYFVQFHGRNNPVLKKKIGFGLTNNGFLVDGSGGFKNESIKYGAALVDMAINIATGQIESSEAADQTGGTENNSKFDSELKDIVDNILEIRKLKNQLILKGKAKNENALQFDLLTKREKLLLSMITGKRKKANKKEVIYLDNLSIGTSLIFNFSENKGFNEDDLQHSYRLVINQSSVPNTQLAVLSKLISSSDKKGIHYIVPAICSVSIIDSSGKVLLRQSENIPQFGPIASLPNRAGLFQSTIDFKLDESTGALLEFKGTSDELDSGVVTGLATSIGANSELSNQFSDEQRLIEEMELEIKMRELQLRLDSLNR